MPLVASGPSTKAKSRWRRSREELLPLLTSTREVIETLTIIMELADEAAF